MSAPYLTLTAIIVGVALLQLANGTLMTFLPVRLTADAYTSTEIGLIATGHAAGFMLGCLLVTRVIRAVGHIRAFAIFAAALSATALAFTIWVDPYFWMVLRFITGFTSAGLFTVAESWLAAQTPSRQRGRVISIYMIFNKTAFASGQLLLTVGDLGSAGFYMISAALYSLSLVPIAMTRSGSPPVPDVSRLGLRALFRIAPAGVVGCFATGIVNSAATAIAPLYGAQLTLSIETIGILMASIQLGSLFLQWPLGWASDRMDRRSVIVFSSAAVAVLSIALGFAEAGWGWILLLLCTLWGGFSLSIYPICISHAQDFGNPEQTVQLSASLLMCWAIGSVIGPTGATLMMDRLGPGGLFFFSAGVMTGLTVFVAWRMTRRAPRPAEERERFVNVPATSPAAMTLDPRNPNTTTGA